MGTPVSAVELGRPCAEPSQILGQSCHLSRSCCSRPPCLRVPPSLLTPECLSSHSRVQVYTQVLTGQSPVCPSPVGTRGLLGSQLTGASSPPWVTPTRPAHISCVYLLHSWAWWLPRSTVTCAPGRNTRVCGSLLCKCHAPQPLDT